MYFRIQLNAYNPSCLATLYTGCSLLSTALYRVYLTPHVFFVQTSLTHIVCVVIQGPRVGNPSTARRSMRPVFPLLETQPPHVSFRYVLYFPTCTMCVVSCVLLFKHFVYHSVLHVQSFFVCCCM
uniref:Uncharacterized protein n=1 Tax=Cacopsylla melanoneura TaxID=428564 RepID=A0A8D9A603_9HEMI